MTATPRLLSGSENRTITLIVHDVTGSRIMRAKATLLSPDRAIDVTANEQGELKFNSVVSGTYDLEVSANFSKTRVIPDLRLSDIAQEPMDLVLDVGSVPAHCGPVNTIDYHPVSDVRTVSGRTIDWDTGKRIGGVKIELIGSPSGTGRTLSVVSGPDGSFALLGVPPGRYSTRAARNSYEPVEIDRVTVPRENNMFLHFSMDKRGHMHICQ